MHTKVPVRVDGRFRLGDMLGSGSYGMSFTYYWLTTLWFNKLTPLISCCISCTEHHQGECSCYQAWTHQPLIFHATQIQSFEAPWRRYQYSSSPLVWEGVDISCSGSWPPWAITTWPISYPQQQIQHWHCCYSGRPAGQLMCGLLHVQITNSVS